MKKPAPILAVLLTAVLAACSNQKPSINNPSSTAPNAPITSKTQATNTPVASCITLKQGPGKGYDKNGIPSDPDFEHLPCIHEGWKTENRPSTTKTGATETYVVGTVTNDSGIMIDLFDIEFPAFDASGKELTKCNGRLFKIPLGETQEFGAYCPDAATKTVGDPFLKIYDKNTEVYK